MSDEGWGVWFLVMFSREYREYTCFQANQRPSRAIPSRYNNSNSYIQAPHIPIKPPYPSLLRYNSPPHSLNLFAACSGVISRCGSAINSYPTKNFLTVALLSSGG